MNFNKAYKDVVSQFNEGAKTPVKSVKTEKSEIVVPPKKGKKLIKPGKLKFNKKSKSNRCV